MNALSGETQLFAEVDGKYGVYTLRELYELHKQGRVIKVPALLNEKVNIGWVEVEDVVSFGKQPLKRIMLDTSRLFVEISEDTIIPAFSPWLVSRTQKQIYLKFKRANKLKITQDPRHNDSLLLTTNIPLYIPEGDEKELEYGFALGFYLSEGNIVKRKHKNTKHSFIMLKTLARKKGMTLEEYLNYKTDIKQVELSVGQADFERKYVDILKKHFKFSKPSKVKGENGYILYSSDLNYIHLIKEYTEGDDSHTKHLKNEVYNRSLKFLEGAMDGFLAGDGTFEKKWDRFRVGITTNYKLRDDLIFLSKALGYDAHINKGSFDKSPSSNNYYYHLHLSIFKNYHRHTALGLVKEHIKSIEDISENATFNLILKPLYPENDARSAFNHLFIVAYGILVSDAVKTFAKLH